MGKLTKPQIDTLRTIANRPSAISTHYGPARALVRDGLAEWRDARFSDLLAITPAGRRALSQAGAIESENDHG